MSKEAKSAAFLCHTGRRWGLMVAMEASSPALCADRLCKQYPPRRALLPWRRAEPPRAALVEVSFELHPGEIVGLVGPNGAGKSTLLRILAGLLLPSAGHASLVGLDVVRDRPRSRAHVGFAQGDDRGLSPRLTARQNLEFFAALYGVPKAETTPRISELCERLEATALLDRAVRTLSTGERARLALARSLLHRPKVLLLDEVTRSLDPGAAARLREKLAREAEGGCAILLCSHDLAEVQSVCRRVLLLGEGRLLAQGTYDEVKDAAARVFEHVRLG